MVSNQGNRETAEPTDGSRQDANHPAKKVSRRKKTLTPNQLFPKSYSGAAGLAEDVRYYGQWMRDEAEKRIGHLYPRVRITQAMIDDGRPDLEPYKNQELTVIAWLWARTVKCPNPACGHRLPMLRSFWLSKKKGREVYAKPIIDKASGTVRFEPTQGNNGVPEHTTDRTGARCLFCDQFIKKPELREISRTHGMNEIPLAIVAEGNRRRVYLPFSQDQIPDVSAPDVPALHQAITDDKRWFSPPQYGLPEFIDLFTPRQLTALTTFSDLVKEAREQVLVDSRQEAEDRRQKTGGRRENAGVGIQKTAHRITAP